MVLKVVQNQNLINFQVNLFIQTILLILNYIILCKYEAKGKRTKF